MRVLWPYLRRFLGQWRRMLLGVLVGAGTLLAGIGLLSLSGWFLSATAVAGLSLFSARAFNYFSPAGGVRFLSIARTVCRYGERLLTHEATFRLLRDLRVWVWRHLLPLSAQRLARLRSGDLLNRLIADIDTLDHLYLRLLTPLAAFVVVVPLLLVFLGRFDAELAWLLCAFLLAMALLFPWLFYRLGRAPGMALQESRRQLRVEILDYLQGQAEWVIFAAAARMRHRLDATAARFLQEQTNMAVLGALSQALLVLLGGWAVLVMLFLAASGVGDRVPPGPDLALMVFAAMASLELLMPLAGAFQHLSGCIRAAERIDELLGRDSAPTPLFPENSVRLRSGALSLQQVDFAYQPGVAVLQGLNLEIAAGRKVAVVGATGSGKSSLLALITREWPASAGCIRLDGREIGEYAEQALRCGMSVMSQRVHLFAATLRDNLTLALQPGETVSDERLQSVLQQVGLAYLLSGEGLEAWIGDGGRRLSGGEQRRIGVARILLREAPLMLLDEPTEGLDRQTEAAILEVLLQAAHGKTLLMITHRQAGLSMMDEVYRLQEGRLQRLH